MATKLIKLPPSPGLKKAVVKDKKPSATQGGTFTSGAWRTRDINTIEGDTDIVSIASNQFTLVGGSYLIYASAPARTVGLHKTRLYNVTSSNIVALGSSDNTVDAAQNNYSHISTKIEIGSPTTFEIQHRCQTTVTNAGFGIAGSSGTETYTSITILKL